MGMRIQRTQRSDRPRVLLMIESSRESGRQFIAGVANYAQHFGPWRFHWQPDGLKGLEQPLGRMKFDGAILRDTADLKMIRAMGLPAVVLGHVHGGVAGAIYVGVDNGTIGRMAADHLLGRGLRHFAFLGYEGIQWSLERETAFCGRLRAIGLTAACQRVPVSAGLGFRGGGSPAVVRDWLLRCPRPVGVMAANDDLGEQVIELCKEASLPVPDQCAVVGVDNDLVVCGLSDPPLTSIGQQLERAGYQAAAALDRLMRGRKPATWHMVTPAGILVERQSTNVFAVKDPAVAKALRFIQDRGSLPAGVEEAARASGVSRRVLEQRFRRAMGQSILKYQHQRRADQIARLLAESSLPLKSIAEQCGFVEQSHMTRFFTSLRGVTPSAFRARLAAVSFLR
jgi:LacI family transcriptional regulator